MFIFLWLNQLLQKLLDDRRPTVELIKKEGAKVLEMADSVDKEKIGKEIDSLGKRWDALLKKAESRLKLRFYVLTSGNQSMKSKFLKKNIWGLREQD